MIIIFIVIAPWIVFNLIFANQNEICLKLIVDSTVTSIPLKTWLYVDAYAMVAMLILMTMALIS